MSEDLKRLEWVTGWLALKRTLLAEIKYMKKAGRVTTSTLVNEENVRVLSMRVEKMKMDGIWTRPPSSDNFQAIEKPPAKDAIHIFPEEIWRKIIANVDDPKDNWSLSNTCQLFDTILSPWKSGWMLEQTLAYVYPHLPREHLLKCRLVSRSWNKAVDTFLEEHPSLHPYDDEDGKKDYRKLDFICPLKEKQLNARNLFVFCNGGEDNSSILDDPRFPKMDGRNPFVGRYVSIKLGNHDLFSDPEPDQPLDPWWERLYKFLNTFGKEIWFLNLTFPFKPNEFVQKKLVSFMGGFLFQSVPNIRKLTLEASGCCFDNAELNDLLPNAPRLESVEFVGFTRRRFNSLFHSLLTKYAFHQLGKLHLNGANFIRVRHMKFENLKELIIDVGEGQNPSVFNELNAFSAFEMQKLTKVQLIFPLYLREYLFEDLTDFVNTLTTKTPLTTLRLAGNLQALRFATDQELEMRKSEQPTYNCEPSSLKTLEVDMDWLRVLKGNPPICFDFLIRYFPKLVHLAVFARETNPILYSELYDSSMEVDILNRDAWEGKTRSNLSNCLQGDELVELHRWIFRRQLYEPVIWELMRLLKVLTVQWDVYTREGYEAYQKNNEIME